MSARELLIAKIREQGNPNDPAARPVVVGVADFFSGNDCLGSIGCNLIPHPGIERFRSVLSEIEEREDVQAVLIEITEVEEDHLEMWPFSDNIFILSSAPRESIAQWLAELNPDEVYQGYRWGTPPAAPEPLPGMKVYGVWWD